MSASLPTLVLDSISVLNIYPDPNQPRKKRDEKADHELAESMRVNNLWQPILVRKEGDKYIIVFGERRWTAASFLGWEKIYCLVTTADAKQCLVLQLIENVQREDLSPEDLAAHLNTLMTEFKSDDSDDKKASLRVLSALIGKSLGWVSEKLALARLPSSVKALKDSNTVKNSRVLIGLAKLSETNPEAADTVIKELEAGKSVTVDVINELRGTQRKKSVQEKPEAVKVSDFPVEMRHRKDDDAGQASSSTAEHKPVASAPSDDIPAHKPSTKRKKRVSDIAKIIGVPDDLPAEDLLEAIAEAYAKLLEKTEAVA